MDKKYDDTNKGALLKTEDSKKIHTNENLNVNGEKHVVFAYKNESDAREAPDQLVLFRLYVHNPVLHQHPNRRGLLF